MHVVASVTATAGGDEFGQNQKLAGCVSALTLSGVCFSGLVSPQAVRFLTGAFPEHRWRECSRSHRWQHKTLRFCDMAQGHCAHLVGGFPGSSDWGIWVSVLSEPIQAPTATLAGVKSHTAEPARLEVQQTKSRVPPYQLVTDAHSAQDSEGVMRISDSSVT